MEASKHMWILLLVPENNFEDKVTLMRSHNDFFYLSEFED